MVRIRRPRTVAWAAAAVLVLTPLAAGCGDGDDGEPTATPTATGTTPDGAASPGGEQPADPDEARAEVEENWTLFFAPDTPVDERVAVLEDGDDLGPVLAVLAEDPNAGNTSADVTDVTFTSATEATVTYDLKSGDTVLLPDSTGKAVLQDETWKVSKSTLCGLAEQSAAGATALPGC
ncbi:hypothetical protein [Streptomyces sp. MUM 178J]|uniref:hypothetical protein n=1 Tax=Streptomyces sp. MUM 178J TaxID=2791991 RepID=UPI001F03DD4F|nr:hypothetical protein [Streptomyces sp. MUM 178J]WRQ78708.1 hypothetical protein I3F59_004545 [Streptomyces sp. MUM 178J]